MHFLVEVLRNNCPLVDSLFSYDASWNLWWQSVVNRQLLSNPSISPGRYVRVSWFGISWAKVLGQISQLCFWFYYAFRPIWNGFYRIGELVATNDNPVPNFVQPQSNVHLMPILEILGENSRRYLCVNRDIDSSFLWQNLVSWHVTGQPSSSTLTLHMNFYFSFSCSIVETWNNSSAI